MKKALFLLALTSLFTCSRDNFEDIIDQSSEASVNLSVNLGNFFLGGTGAESPWVHQYQSSVDITFSSTTSLFTKTVTFNPNDLANFPETLLPYGTYTWEISNTGTGISVSDVLYVYGTSASPFTVDAASVDVNLSLSTDFGLVTVSATNMESVTIRQNGTTTALVTKDGYFYGYINSNLSDYTVVIATTDGLGGADQITTPQASIHYNYNVVLESLGQAGVTMALTDVFLLEDRDILASSDDDQDGVANSIDLCPETRAGAPVDANGCLDVIELDANGVTIKAKPGAAAGDQQELGGITYTVVDEATLRTMVANDEDVTTVVTTLVTNMSYLFFNKNNFNQNIASWDVSNVTRMEVMFHLSAFNQNIGLWDVGNVVNMAQMFHASPFNQNIGSWNVSNVTNMAIMFAQTPFSGGISNWDVGNVTNMASMFSDAIAFDDDLSNWNVSNVTDMNYLFHNTSFNGNIGNWDVGKVTNMDLLFRRTPFNQDIGNWDVSSVLTMAYMFDQSSFNQDLNSWNVGQVTNMTAMFANTPFNGNISSWNVANVRNMASMFSDALAFNGDLSNWDVSSVTDMNYMFHNSSFNGDISNWNVGNVTNMDFMFRRTPFNQDIGNWDVSNVLTMQLMFEQSSFNQPIGNWDVSKVTSMNQMLQATPFNQDIGNWNVGNVTDMNGMFNSSNFNQDIRNWDVSKVTNMYNMFANMAFNQDLSSWDVAAVTQCTSFSVNNTSWTLPKPNFTNCTP